MNGAIQAVEIRVCWNVNGRSNRDGNPVDAGAWRPDSPKNREALRIIVQSGNERDGAGSHWIDIRNIPAVSNA